MTQMFPFAEKYRPEAESNDCGCGCPCQIETKRSYADVVRGTQGKSSNEYAGIASANDSHMMLGDQDPPLFFVDSQECNPPPQLESHESHDASQSLLSSDTADKNLQTVVKQLPIANYHATASV